MVNLKAQYLRLKNEVDSALMQVVESAQYINGPQVQEFAGALQKYLSVEAVVPCANGTDALQLALMALELQPGDEVITTAFSFVASAEVIALLGLTPVFADINPQTFNIDAGDIEKRITSKTKVILPVHLFGQAADMEAIMQVAGQYGLYVIEDVAQSLGATCYYKGKNRLAGTIGHIGCTSFFPSKNLGCFGDGGACFTRDTALADRMKMIAGHGSNKQYHHQVIGINSRLDTLQAAVLCVKLPYLDAFISERRKVAGVYDVILKEVGPIEIPVTLENARHSYNQYTIRVKNGKRDALMEGLDRMGIPSRIYYPLPLHQQLVFNGYICASQYLPHAEKACDEVLSLPLHTEMEPGEAEYIARSIVSLLIE
ncbi:MAG: DegT/DnrJ/EryC1/StrS family aminotransferase [Spirochaetales bacterium]|nr:DegT/DnrJ/EryC1/StrS family aminotransferase [Spirochaetales bacterium]